MNDFGDRLKEWQNETVVVDLAPPYVAVGTLVDVTPGAIELRDADMHDFRDSDTTRELYLVKTARVGVQSNRARLFLRMEQVVGVSRLADVAS